MISLRGVSISQVIFFRRLDSPYSSVMEVSGGDEEEENREARETTTTPASEK